MRTLQELVTQARKAAEEIARQRTLPQDDGDLYMDSPGFTGLDRAEAAQRAAVHALGQRHTEIQELIDGLSQELDYLVEYTLSVKGKYGSHYSRVETEAYNEALEKVRCHIIERLDVIRRAHSEGETE